MSSQNAIVTRSPNHWCAISCDATTIHVFCRAFEPDLGSISISVSLHVIRPAFSIAPKPTVIGMLSMSSFG
jgi:hypothetical protein